MYMLNRRKLVETCVSENFREFRCIHKSVSGWKSAGHTIFANPRILFYEMYFMFRVVSMGR